MPANSVRSTVGDISATVAPASWIAPIKTKYATMLGAAIITVSPSPTPCSRRRKPASATMRRYASA